MSIQLSDHFTYGSLIRFTLPSICMMIFTSIYGMVDGFFISNLVGNAVRYGGENRHVVVRILKEDNGALCQVQDFGPGIPEEELEHIWGRYHRASAHTARSASGGTGLGLSIVKEIIKAHNENINVVSTPEVGTEFTFSLAHSDMNEEED